MKFLCDVHIPIKLSKEIEQLGFHSTHVNFILNKWNSKDSDIAKYADDQQLILITKDQDFRNSFLVKRTPQKLIKINLGNISNNELIALFEQRISSIQAIDLQNESYMIELGLDNFWIVTK